MAGKSRKKKRKKYFRLKKNRSLFSLVIFFMTFIVASTALVAFASIFMVFMINSHIQREYESKSTLVRLYEKEISPEDEFAVFDSAGMDYFIRGRDGSVIHSKGLITCSDNGGYYNLSLDETPDETKGIYIYADSVSSIIIPGNDGEASYDMVVFMKKIKTAIKECYGNNRPSYNRSVLDMPVWICVDFSDGQTLVFKSVVSIMSDDMTMALAMVIMMLILFAALFVTMIVSAARSARDQHRINSLFFTDIRIKAKNWIWFLYNSEQKVGKNTRKKFAITDLELMGYRRYCVCNSLDDGEVLLKQVYDRICSLIDKKELCAHNSEGSFALLLEYSDEESLKKRVEDLLHDLSSINGLNLVFHAGIAPVDNRISKKKEDGIDIESDYANACAASATLADSEGTCAAFYDKKLVEEQRWEDTVAQMQQKAVSEEEFVVYYQPKYDPGTNELRGAEALIRWQSPEYGFLSPYKFIPIFEKNGFITEIDHYMIIHAARDQRRWLDMGLKCVPISVNVSRAHFIEEDLAEQIRDMVDREGTPHELIEIELTESAFFDDKKAMIDTIKRLHEYGFKVSMDDFGSGYSSLNSLKDMPLDVLKIDAGFFKGEAAGTDRGDKVVSEVIRLAKSLEMKTVAEGVESKEQVEFLDSKGCDMIQGYYFAKPMPGSEYEGKIRQGVSDQAAAEMTEVKGEIL